MDDALFPALRLGLFVTRVASLLVVALIAIASCTAGRPSASAPSSAARASCLGRIGRGKLFVIAGPTIYDADLFRIDLTTGCFRRLTTGARVSSLTAWRGRIVVADARLDVDRLERLSRGSLAPVAGLGRPHAFTPALRGRVLAYVDLADRAGTRTALEIWRRGCTPRSLLESASITSPVWTKGGALAALVGAGKRAHLVRTTRGGDIAAVAAVPGMAMLAISEAGPMAVSRVEPPRTRVLSGRAHRRTVAGWFALVWLGRSLLLSRPDGALATLHASGGVAEIGTSPVGPVWAAVVPGVVATASTPWLWRCHR
jgi:hypothetical protein